MTLPSQNQPYWEHGGGAKYAPLTSDIATDVAVVGAGVTGLTAAMRLLEQGRQVAVLDMTRVGGGTTGHSTGHLDTDNDRGWRTVVQKFGVETARRAAAAKRGAVDQVEGWVRGFNLDCDFRRVSGYLYVEEDGDLDELVREHDATTQLGLEAHFEAAAPLPFPVRGALRHTLQARIDPLAYVRELARVYVARGGLLYEHTRAEDISESGGQVSITTPDGRVTAGAVVLAGHAPLAGRVSLQSRSYPYQSYVLAVRVRNEIPDALYWDTADPYHYTRWVQGGDPHLLIIGGADHQTGQNIDTQQPFGTLERYVHARYAVEQFEARWSHEFFESGDGLPYIGKVPRYRSVYVGATYSGDGLTFGTAAGMIIADQVMRFQNPWESAFDPSRLPVLASAKRLTSGMIHIARHYVGDRLAGPDVKGLDAIPRGEGRLVMSAGERLAVYRDEEGQLHAFSPVCQHMGCIVHWNSAERTWDCPCHGGRYDVSGEVISGPPKHGLIARDLQAEVPLGEA